MLTKKDLSPAGQKLYRLIRKKMKANPTMVFVTGTFGPVRVVEGCVRVDGTCCCPLTMAGLGEKVGTKADPVEALIDTLKEKLSTTDPYLDGFWNGFDTGRIDMGYDKSQELSAQLEHKDGAKDGIIIHKLLKNKIEQSSGEW